jgi:U4/U6.U5 tri-snRNP component SNU23
VPASERAALTARDEFFDFQDRVGKVTAVNEKDRSSGGFYCELCDVLLRDSLSFTNHMNGRKHLRKAGISEYTKRSTLQEVLDVLEFGRRKKYPERYALSRGHPAATPKPKPIAKIETEDSEEVGHSKPPTKVMKRQENEDEAIHSLPPPEAITESKMVAKNDITAEDDEDMMSMIGFSSFGGAKQKKTK